MSAPAPIGAAESANTAADRLAAIWTKLTERLDRIRVRERVDPSIEDLAAAIAHLAEMVQILAPLAIEQLRAPAPPTVWSAP